MKRFSSRSPTPNDELTELQAQIRAISSHISTLGDILSAIGKVMALIPVA